jgi:hypothetical protein
MNINSVQEALHKQPFQPFVLRLADGRAFSVPHPDFVAIAPRVVVVVSAADGSISHVEPLLIVSVDYPGVVQGTQSSETNGK